MSTTSIDTVRTGELNDAPPDLVFDWSTQSSAASSSATGSTDVHDDRDARVVGAYNTYLPVHKREALAKAEFDVAMLERELRLKELDKDRAKYMAPKRRVFTLPYVLNPAQLELATQRFPRTVFHVGLDANHDHPIAHLETMIASERAIRMIPGGHTVFDIYGSPQRTMELNRKQQRSNNPKAFFSIVNRKTEKDVIRSLHWAGEDFLDLGDDLNLYDVFGPGADVFDLDEDVSFLFTHTLYYLSDDEIFMLLNSSPRARGLAVVHRHQHDSGTMFAGEATYAKIGGCVEQVNTATGERYVHRDLSYLFTSVSKVVYTSNGAYTWTLHKVTDETWIVEMAACSDRLNERFSKRVKGLGRNGAIAEVNSQATVASSFPHPALEQLPGARCFMVGGVPVVSFAGGEVQVKVTCPQLVEYLMVAVAGKPRTPVTYQDTFNLARTHVAGGNQFAGKLNFKVAAAEIADHVALAFVSGLKGETAVLRSLAVMRDSTREHHALLDFDFVSEGKARSAFQAGLSVASKVNSARKEGDVVSGVIRALRH
jgi:hypothetical protein